MNAQSSSTVRAVGRYLLVLCAAVSCVTSPKSNTSLPDSSVDFQGVYDKAGAKISIQARESDGTWTTLGTEKVGKDGHWTVHVTIPERFTSSDGCGPVTFRAISNKSSAPLPALDAECLAALGPDPSEEEQLDCSTEQIVLSPPRAYTGDLAIVGQADADRYACITTVNGNLNIDSGGEVVGNGLYLPNQNFRMPNLKEVTGNLVIDGGHVDSTALPALEHVGGAFEAAMQTFLAVTPPPPGSEPDDLHTQVPSMSFPLLARVEGNVALHIADSSGLGAGGGGILFRIDTPQLAFIGGDVLLDNQGNGPPRIQSLQSTTRIEGNLTIHWPHGEISPYNVLEDLESVGGDVDLTFHVLIYGFGPNLDHIDGSLRFHNAPFGSSHLPSILPVLRRVGGNLELDPRDGSSDCPMFPVLSEIGGLFRFTSTDARAFGAPAGLTLGGLDVQGFPSTTLPLPANLRVLDSGPVTIRSNPDLCQCQVDALGAELQLGGWTGTLDSSDNGTSATGCAVACPRSAATCSP